MANYEGKLYNLPFNMNTFSQIFGVTTPEEAKAVIDEQRAEIKGEPKNLEEQAISLVQDCFAKIAKYDGEIPGASREECGNYQEHDLIGAKALACDMCAALKSWQKEQLIYPE